MKSLSRWSLFNNDMVLLWVRAEKDSHVVGLRVSVRAHGAAVVASLTAYNEAETQVNALCREFS